MRKLLVVAFLPVVAAAQAPRFQISFPSSASAGPITGRVYVALSRGVAPQPTPINQADETGVPLFGLNVENLTAGTRVTIDAAVPGYPIRSLRDIPAGEYWVQPFVNVYTRFPRADG